MLRTAGLTQKPGLLGTRYIRAAPTLPPEALGHSVWITQVKEKQTAILFKLLHLGVFWQYQLNLNPNQQANPPFLPLSMTAFHLLATLSSYSAIALILPFLQ